MSKVDIHITNCYLGEVYQRSINAVGVDLEQTATMTGIPRGPQELQGVFRRPEKGGNHGTTNYLGDPCLRFPEDQARKV
ncbi:hypothetical protein H5410_026136 [Solanum commersonii]|uniref:Uncharacterized protein n=1 Tax=Solanum commersonii TaxID=4109 RepID=A0A9J5YZY4_SOLCO|nr:hypothetical protein H5410_026136 [Solanum commersonii]